MARGWESKSVEGQMEEAEAKPRPVSRRLTAEEQQKLRAKESLLLSRKHVQYELSTARNPRYLQILQRALDDLDKKLLALG